MNNPLATLSAPKIAAAAALVGLLVGIGAATWIASMRLDAAENRRRAEVADLKHNHEKAVRLATEAHARDMERARETEQALRGDIDRLHAQHVQEKQNAKAEADRLIADLRAGSRRLSVAVSSCSPAQVGQAGPGATASGGHQEARAELEPAHAARIIGITDDGDAAIRDLNTCIDSYEAVRRRINAQDVAQ